MSKDNAVSLSAPESGAISDPLTELPRRNAKRLVEVAVAAEFEEYLSASQIDVATWCKRSQTERNLDAIEQATQAWATQA